MNFKPVLSRMKSELEPFKFECYPFKVGWYNNVVDERFRLNYDADTFAVLVLNIPSMFETLFLPFLFENYKNEPEKLEDLSDPIDYCMKITFENVKKDLEASFDGLETELISDYDMEPGTRRARIVMQTCAHVSGAACYYDPKNVDNCLVHFGEKNPKKTLMGVCLHPKYGGWFAMRSVFIFKNIQIENDELRQVSADDPLGNDIDKMIDVLKKFNYYWKDGRYRETIRVEQSYSRIQREYFNLEPKYRKKLLKEWLEYKNHKVLCIVYEKYSAEELKKRNYLLKNFYIV